MKENISLVQIQELEFGILKYIKDVCEKHGIQYYLAYGTLIGAVRHQGFIPWDDDIDIMMPRPEYIKLLEVMRQDPHPFYKMVSVDTNDLFQVPLPKIVDTRTLLIQDYDIIEPVPLGVYVDIFLMDGAGNTYENALQYYDQSFKLYCDWKKSRLKLFPSNMSKIKGALRWVKNLPYILKGSQFFMDRLTKHNSFYSYQDSQFIATFETGTRDACKCVWDREVFTPGTRLEFNGELFQVPQNYQEVLTVEYGDYMILPSEDKRVSHHFYNLKWKDHKFE